MTLSILALKPSHDGAVTGICNKELLFSIEAEKNSVPRHSWLRAETITAAFRAMPNIPDVVCVSGWGEGSWRSAQYLGHDASSSVVTEGLFFGHPCKYFSSSHERSHLIGTFGLSPYPLGTTCYALVWEGGLGCFYKIDEQLNVIRLRNIITEPGERYAFLYHLAKKTDEPYSEGGDAGKLMALAAYSDRSAPNTREQEFINTIFGEYNRYSHPKIKFKDSPYYCIGEEHEWTKQLAGKLSDAIFNTFLEFAKSEMREGYPLLISGGCGLNCEWNSRWRDTGLFSDVFVTPIPNDSGSALGTAIDAQFYFTGDPKISWSVYSGEDFEWSNESIPSDYSEQIFSFEYCAELLMQNKVLAWVQGKYEIGPRALGNRSLLAAPFSKAMLERLNSIKQREQYRPIAPVCLQEDMTEHFDITHPSPYMLYFCKVKNPLLQAITHIDQSARPQSVTRQENETLYDLLGAFKSKSGVGVLCNTSLNYKGKGFINQNKDLFDYCTNNGVDGCVVGNRLFLRNV